MKSSRSVSLVVPMYNEEESVGHFLDVAIPALEAHAGDWEIVLVDDGSKDRTGEIARARAAAEPRIRVLSHEKNRGLGGTLRTGFAAAQKEWILYSDCDLPWDLDEAGRLFRAAEITGCDVVAAFRHDRKQEGIGRAVYSFVYNGLVQTLFGLGLWLPIGVVGVLLLISGPSMILASIKLRRRNLGPLLDANGWAINTKAKINIPFGTALTQLAAPPPGTASALSDPFADRKRRWPIVLGVLVLAAAAALALWLLGVLDAWLPEILRRAGG